jgi:hypothetical protein
MKTFAETVTEECLAIANMLIAKNKAYGDSALSPLRVFSKASPKEGILVRIDDKLSRIARGQAAGEDAVMDLIGYLIILRVQERRLSDETSQPVQTDAGGAATTGG